MVTGGFVQVREASGAEWTGFVSGGRIVRVPETDGDGILHLLESGRLNDRAFVNALIDRGAEDGSLDYVEVQSRDARTPGPVLGLPFLPPEVWGVGVTYEQTAEQHEADMRADGRREGLYAHVFKNERPEIFFKGVARHCVGHNDFFTVRGDSSETIVEPELACVFDGSGKIAAFMIASDVTAWDIEKESPLFLSYAKVFQGSSVLGPLVVPAILVPDPLSLRVACVVRRGPAAIYAGEGNTRNMTRDLDILCQFLLYCNPVPAGTVLCTGTAIGMPAGFRLADGDVVEIEIEQLGRLRSVARVRPLGGSAK